MSEPQEHPGRPGTAAPEEVPEQPVGADHMTDPVRRRRRRAAGGRPHTIRVTLSDEEYEPIHTAARRAGLSDASWLGLAGSRVAARPGDQGPPRGWTDAIQMLMITRGELAEDRRVLRNVGGNLNDVARAANTDGVLAAETSLVLGLVERAVARIEATIAVADEQTHSACRRLIRARSRAGSRRAR